MSIIISNICVLCKVVVIPHIYSGKTLVFLAVIMLIAVSSFDQCSMVVISGMILMTVMFILSVLTRSKLQQPMYCSTEELWNLKSLINFVLKILDTAAQAATAIEAIPILLVEFCRSHYEI